MSIDTLEDLQPRLPYPWQVSGLLDIAPSAITLRFPLHDPLVSLEEFDDSTEGLVGPLADYMFPGESEAPSRFGAPLPMEGDRVAGRSIEVDMELPVRDDIQQLLEGATELIADYVAARIATRLLDT